MIVQGTRKEVIMSKLISIAVTLAFLAIRIGNLPDILFHIRKAQIQLLVDSQASKWTRAMTLPSH